MTRRVVFSDLDGTLLSHREYDWTPAEAALRALRQRSIPLVFASSKTRREIEAWRARIGNDDPFISENGGALYAPRGAVPIRPERAAPANEYWRVELGTAYPALRDALTRLGADLGVELRGFGDMTADEVARLTGLSDQDALLALAREYDEPFVPARPLGEEETRRLTEKAARLGLRITRGGRFYHLMGNASKAEAARILVAAYGEPVATIVVGDSANDLELLAWADHAIVVARPDGSHCPELRRGLPQAAFTSAPGPAGFAEGVLRYLESQQANE